MISDRDNGTFDNTELVILKLICYNENAFINVI